MPRGLDGTYTCIISLSHRTSPDILHPEVQDQGLSLTITAHGRRSQVQAVHALLGTGGGRVRVVFAVGVVGVDRLLARCHGLGEDGVDITVGSSGLKHRSPVNFAGMIGMPRHNRAFGVLDDRGLYLLKGSVNTQVLARCIGLHEVRVLLGSRQPGASLMRLSSEPIVRLTVHPIDRRHRKAQRLLMIREARAAGGHPVSVHGPLAVSRTRHTIGGRDGASDFILDGLGIRSLRSLQMRLGMRQVSRSRGVSASKRTLLEVALEDVAAGEGILAENTHVGAITGIYSIETPC